MADTPGPGAEAITAAAEAVRRAIILGGSDLSLRMVLLQDEAFADVAKVALTTAWPLVRAEARHCPTLCDADCEQVCHETHVVKWKRDHDPEQCRATFAAEAAASERARIRQLAVEHQVTYDAGEPCGKNHCADPARCPNRKLRQAPFADLLREPESHADALGDPGPYT